MLVDQPLKKNRASPLAHQNQRNASEEQAVAKNENDINERSMDTAFD
jgi:hypothetical protein